MILSFSSSSATPNNFHGQSSATPNAADHQDSRTLYSSFSSPVRRDHWRVFLYHRIAPIDAAPQHACYGSPLQSGVNGTFAAAPPSFGRPLMCRWQVNVRPGKNIEFRFDQQSQYRFVPRNFNPTPSFDAPRSPVDNFHDNNIMMGNADYQLRSGLSLSRRLRILNLENNNLLSDMTTASNNVQTTQQQHCQREWISIYDGNEIADYQHNRVRSAGNNDLSNFQSNAVCMPNSAKPKARICAGSDVPETLVLESNSAVVEVCSGNPHSQNNQQQHQQQNHQFNSQRHILPPLRFGSTLLDPPQEPQHLISGGSSPSSTSLIRVSWAVNEELYLERVCSKRYTDNNAKAGIIMSPGFGVRNYPDNIAACDYEFIADPGMMMEFNTEVFHVEEPTTNGLCMFDSLTVLEKFSTSQFEPVASFCGLVGPQQLLTTHPHVKLRFRTDSTYNERGFIIKWNMIAAPHKNLECGRSAVSPILAQAQQMKQLLPGPVLAPIVGGAEARPYSWPWQVGILTKGTNKVFCGAALIAPQWLVSAAHCFYPGLPGQIRQYEVRIGEHDLLRYEGPELRLSIDRVVMNPKFDPDTVDSDISLIRLEQPIPIRSDDDSKRLICLPPRKRKLKPGTVCYIVGWGETSPMDGNMREAQQSQQQHLAISLAPLATTGVLLNGTDPPKPAKLIDTTVHESQSLAELLSMAQQSQQNASPIAIKSDRHRLRQAPVPILPQKICKGFFPDAITPNMFCAGYRDGAVDACQGDSGGPLVCLNENGAFEITGVTSWGFGCAQPKLPGVYVHVAHYVEWIQDVLANN